VAIALVLASTASRADDAPEVVQARAEFVRGTDLAKHAQWAEALSAFEASAKLRPHAVTTYNIGYCHRALGHYTLARDVLLRAIAENDAAKGAQLADALVAEDRALVGEIDRLLATVTVTLDPANAAVAVDGRPLAVRGDALVAGVRDPGEGEAPPAGTFKVLVDPGAHVFAFARPGFATAVVNRTVPPGAAVDLRLELDRLPATLRVESSPPGGVVAVDDVDVGIAPVSVTRPAGSYRVVVRKAGFKKYESQVGLEAGQEASLRAALSKEETALTSRWWFWTAAAVVVAGVAVGTYALTRSETTTQAPLDGGGLGWTVKLR
jgi:hypothetical protein